MMRFENDELSQEFQRAFGVSVGEITIAQLWWLVKFSKHVRGRCRSNAALRSYLERNFSAFRFDMVTREGKRGPYQALAITPRGGKSAQQEVEGEETE